jgi:hypothetical protein
MPTHECRGANDREELEDRRKPSIQLDEEPAIVVRKSDATLHLTAQNDQLMSERRILRFKPAFRPERGGQGGQDEKQQRDHHASLRDSVTSSTRIGFSVHTTGNGITSKTPSAVPSFLPSDHSWNGLA